MKLSSKAAWCAVVLGLAVGCAHAPRSKHRVARAEVYSSPDGPRVEVLTLEGEGDRCLVRVLNVSTPKYAGHVFDCTREVQRDSTRHRIQWDGAGWTALELSRDGARAWLPLQRDPAVVKLDPTAKLDVAAMLESNVVETESGVLSGLAKLDRAASLQRNERDLAEAVAQAKTACGVELKVTHDFQPLSDEQLLEWAYGSICGEVVSSITSLCGVAPAARDFFRTEVTGVHCAVGREPSAPSLFALDGKTLRFTQNKPDNVRDHAISFLDGVGSKGASGDVPWGDGSSLRNRLVLATAKVCADAAGHVVALDPRTGTANGDPTRPTLFSGTTAQLSAVPRMNRYAEDFLEPRHRRRDRPPDEQYRSHVAFETATHECLVVCGNREVHVPMLSPEAAAKVLLGAKVTPAPFTRKPHALLRDTTGVYYYVDTSTLPEREKDYQVWVGQRGRMKKQQLVNALSDSAGDLFTTKSGSLRLSLDREQPSFWQEGKTKRPLRVVPSDENLDVIFLELGVYAGARLGTPCDDF